MDETRGPADAGGTGESASDRPRSAGDEIRRRRTFAIISHPDAGKTTLTEKLLLYGGAIHLAGSVKARRAARHATSDWMEMEKERGISITTSVLQFEYAGYQVNLLDTPGHQDFSEDTYRTLLAADSAAMLLDNRKGVEEQTRKLFRVCRMRRLPIFTLVNKCDRVGADPLGLLDGIEAELGIRPHPITWPVVDGGRFAGAYDRRSGRIHLFERTGDHGGTRSDERSFPLEDPAIQGRLSDASLDLLREEVELLDSIGGALDPEDVRAGTVTPTFFGSALHNLGVAIFLEYFLGHAPPPGPREAAGVTIRPEDEEFAGFVFKIQANMDPKHRDRIAFVRICSGRYEPGMTVRNVRTGQSLRLASARRFLARDREQVESAVAGDIVGVHDRGSLRIGDTLATDGRPAFDDIPRFTPERFGRPILADPMRRKHLDNGLRQLSEEGAIQVLYPERPGSPNPWVAAVGPLQFDVLLHRLEHEYGVPARLEPLPYAHARWAVGPRDAIERFARGYLRKLAFDAADRPVVLLENDFALRDAAREAPEHDIALHEVSP